jgi:hypothetical protein
MQTEAEKQNQEMEDAVQEIVASRLIHLVICEKCFWCASFLSGALAVEQCPSCANRQVEAIPIGLDDELKFDCARKDGLLLILL